ncbi:MAG: serine/threonine protein kinase [Nannocystaceae bacterium]|nr:serine/threonine protein kinase [Nannocystaceae bacterium]
MSSQPIPSTELGAGVQVELSDDIGKTIGGRYEITDIIGEGGMGVVYEAWDAQVERKVAIKLVRSDTTDTKFLTRFRRELEITCQLRHPSTIRVFEHGETADGRPYMVMELLTGESLAERLERGSIPEMEAIQIARQVAESLSEAHEHGVFHRDLKPDNIFIETVGVSKVVKVLDFGIAGGVDATRLTQAGEVFGTPQYMSPEQCNGLPLDHRTDIYSLAAILYEMIEGRPPFSAETPMATMLKHVRAKVPPARNAQKETSKVILMGLRKDRGKRIQTAGRFAELLGQSIGNLRAIKEGRGADSGPQSGPTTGRQITGGAPMPMVTGSHAVPTLTGYGAPPEERAGKTIAIVLGVVALLLVALLVFGEIGGGGSKDAVHKPAEAAASTKAADAKPEAPKKFPFNRPLVRTNVEGAAVLVDGSEQCKTPCVIKVPVGDNLSHEIVLRKAGYTDVVQNWRPNNVSEPLPALPDMKEL